MSWSRSALGPRRRPRSGRRRSGEGRRGRRPHHRSCRKRRAPHRPYWRRVCMAVAARSPASGWVVAATPDTSWRTSAAERRWTNSKGGSRELDRDACRAPASDRAGDPRRKVRDGAEPLVMVTAYDAPGARIVDDAGVDLILVGDTLRHGGARLRGHASGHRRRHRPPRRRGRPSQARRPGGRRPSLAELPRVGGGHGPQRGSAHPGRAPRPSSSRVDASASR